MFRWCLSVVVGVSACSDKDLPGTQKPERFIVEGCNDNPPPPALDTDPRVNTLEVVLVSEFSLDWDDLRSGGWFDGSFFRPLPPEGFFALGFYGEPGYSGRLPNDDLRPAPFPTNGLVLAARELQEGALAPPVAYERYYGDWGSGAQLDGSFWRPVAPEGYVCLGHVAQRGYDSPALDEIRCVRDDLVAPGRIGNSIWNDRATDADWDFASWQVVPADEHGLHVGTFVGGNVHRTPPSDPLYTLDVRWVRKVIPTPELTQTWIETYGPIIRIHPDELFQPDDAVATLDESTILVWGLVENEHDYDSLDIQPAGAHKTSADTLLDDVEQYVETDALVDHNSFKYWLELELGQQGSAMPPANGDPTRARILVRLHTWNHVFTEIQFWIFYPFNGPGKFYVSYSSIADDHVVMSEPGRHYGDWEMVAVRVENTTEELAAVYLSRHAGSEWLGAKGMAERLEFMDSHPVVYSAKDSHAHYPTAGRQYYKRVVHNDYFLGTLDVDLEDWTDTGGNEIETFRPDRHVVVCSSLPGHDPDFPPWLAFDARWGQYERLSYSYSVASVYTYRREEVGSGPSGPPFKGVWQKGASAPQWWWLPNPEGGELCVDGVDNDGDGHLDCSDEDCELDVTCLLD